MKKRILSICLVLAMLLALIPVSVAVAETEPTGADGSAWWKDGSLYVDDDSLTVLLSAYAGYATAVEAVAGTNNRTWHSAKGEATATLTGADRAWEDGENGGFTYLRTVPADVLANIEAEFAKVTGEEGAPTLAEAHAAAYTIANAWNTGKTGHGVNLGIANLPERDYTLEFVWTPVGLKNEDGSDFLVPNAKQWNNWSAFQIGPLAALAFYATSHTISAYGSGADAGNQMARYIRWGYSSTSKWGAAEQAPYGSQYGTLMGTLTKTYQVSATYGTTVTLAVEDADAATATGTYNVYTNTVRTDGYVTKVTEANGPQYRAKDNAKMAFTLMNSLPGEIYAVRVYSRVLTEAERVQNHFADLVYYYDLSLAGHTAEDVASLAPLFSKNTLSKDNYAVTKAVLQKRLDLISVAENIPGRDLYVQEGLVTLLAAYSGYNTGAVASEDGYTWVDGRGANAGTLLNGINTWEYGENGGWYYHGTNTDKAHGLIFDIAALPTGNFTVETVLTLGMASEGSVSTYVPQSFAYGPLMGWFNAGGTANNLQLRWSYGVKDGEWGFDGTNTVRDQSWSNRTGQTISTAVTLEMDAENGTSVYTFYNTGKSPTTRTDTTVSIAQANGGKPNFRLMYGARGRLYAVRIYDRVLTEEEMAQNLFADKAYFYGLDVAGLDEGGIEALKAELASRALTEEGYAETRAALQAFVEERNALAEAKKENDAVFAETLYHKDGLSVLLAAFSGYSTATEADGNNILWRNAANYYQTATLVGGKDGGSWQRLANGFDYSRVIPDEIAAVTDDNGAAALNWFNAGAEHALDLGIGLLPDGDYTVEVVYASTGIQKSDGTAFIAPAKEGGNKRTELRSVYAFQFGPMAAMVFTADAYNMDRPVYDEGGNVAGYEANVLLNVFRWGYARKANYTYDSAQTGDFRGAWGSVLGAAKYKTTSVLTFGMTHLLNEGEIPTSTYEIYKDTAAITQKGSFTTATEKQDGTAENEYVAKNENMSFTVLKSVPGTVYAVRVYDRAVSEEVMAQNHLADLLYFYGIEGELLARVKQAAAKEDATELNTLAAHVKNIPLVTDETAAEKKAEVEEWIRDLDKFSVTFVDTETETPVLTLRLPDGTVGIEADLSREGYTYIVTNANGLEVDLAALTVKSDITLYVTYTEEGVYKKGDVNGDGTIDVQDVALILRYMNGDSTAKFYGVADLVPDGSIDVQDVARLLQFLNGAISEL